MKLYFLFSCLLPLLCCGELSEKKLKTIYNGLNPSSISQHLAFYSLYSDQPIGKQALKDLSALLSDKPLILSSDMIKVLIEMMNKPIDQPLLIASDDIFQSFNLINIELPHTKLKGHSVWTEEDVQSLPLEEIDLARGLFLSQFGPDKPKIQAYEMLLDLMALQIKARLPQKASPEEIIRVINTFIFDELGFRFPPHSLYAKNIDLYTYLPSVLDSHRGVCLGVSTLYLCLGQRLSLPLEIITPPGHIYIRYHSENKIINIETTARGIHIDCEDYLGIKTRALQIRTLREVIGMAHFNQASVYWQNKEYDKAVAAYLKAEPYMLNDPLLKELLGYALLMTDQKEKGEQKLRDIQGFVPDHAIMKETVVEDYFKGHIDAEGIKVLFMHVDETRESILLKKEALEKTLKKWPFFRAGIASLAETWLELHRSGEALEVLNRFLILETKDPEIHYYVAMIYERQNNYPKAWFHLQQAEKLLKEKNHVAKPLKELRRELLSSFPE